jgi:N6-L-threonylcarbamoyladenine synthase
MATILAIETSCDETAVAIVKNRQVCSNIVASQVKIHRPYGGVVPEVASREHLEVINPAIEEALAEAQLDWPDIDAIAATCAPGLLGALLVGLTAAKTLALVRQKPFIGVHHLEGHIYASYLSEPELEPPFLCLLVSGGHTSSIYVKDCGKYETLGKTRDDAAGEAFDKAAEYAEGSYVELSLTPAIRLEDFRLTGEHVALGVADEAGLDGDRPDLVRLASVGSHRASFRGAQYSVTGLEPQRHGDTE